MLGISVTASGEQIAVLSSEVHKTPVEEQIRMMNSMQLSMLQAERNIQLPTDVRIISLPEAWPSSWPHTGGG